MNLIKTYLHRYRKLLIISLILATINQVFSLVSPQIFRVLIDQYANVVSDHTAQSYIYWILKRSLLGVLAAWVSRIAKTFQDYYVNLMSQTIWSRIYAQWVEHAFELPYKVFENRQSWSLLDKLLKARQDIQKLLTSVIDTVFLTSIGMILVTIYAFWVDWRIGTIYTVTLPVLAYTTYTISRRVKTSQQHIVQTSSELSWATIENIKNVMLIKSLGLEQQEVTHLTSVNEQLIALEVDKLKIIKTLTFTQWTLINLLRTILQAVMLWLVFTGDITLWEFFSLLFYSFLMYNPLYQLPTVAKHFQEARASSETLQQIFDLDVETHNTSWVHVSSLKSIEFSHVSFAYPHHAEPPIHIDTKNTSSRTSSTSHNSSLVTLDDVSWSITSWETIAFVWPSGSGKSTMIKLLSGLYEIDQWTIIVNWTDAETIARTSIKEHLWVVTQDTQLFTGTIKDNLLFVAPHASDQECREALSQASLATFVKNDTQWLDARIWEWWLKLSWWQKQRLAIARALIRHPDLLVFDEATSALDSLTETAITDTIKTISRQNDSLMTILIAHRLSTVMHADTIYVLEQWSIVEKWSHDELLTQKWLYYAMWRQQVWA